LGGNFPAESPPQSRSIQLRLCAEDPGANFALSIGKITEFHVPTGNGIRIDTQISTPPAVVVGSDFDNMLAKVIVTAADWESTVRKARRALEDVRINGVKTNIDLLRGIVGSSDFESGNIDTRWLETNIEGILQSGKAVSSSIQSTQSHLQTQSDSSSAMVATASNYLFRKGDAWSITLNPTSEETSESQSKPVPHHLRVTRVLRNDFPASLSADIEYTSAPSTTRSYQMLLESSTGGAGSASSSHRMGDLANPSHICLPMSGKLIEVLVEEGDIVEEDAVVAFVKQMKMELEVRSPRRGRVVWAFELEGEEGEDVRDGTLLAEIEEVEDAPGKVEMKGKL
jgi:acetyl/propionyl-CoA carboxylase alpha subunit